MRRRVGPWPAGSVERKEYLERWEKLQSGGDAELMGQIIDLVATMKPKPLAPDEADELLGRANSAAPTRRRCCDDRSE